MDVIDNGAKSRSTGAGYSGTPLAKKLGWKPSQRIVVRGAPEEYWARVEGCGATFLQRLADDLDGIHVFARSMSQLRAWDSWVARLAPAGSLWISWPKKASGVETELTGDVVRAFGLAKGLVDVKVCAVDETWSGLKFVRRLEDR